jgi:hypothetical protein
MDVNNLPCFCKPLCFNRNDKTIIIFSVNSVKANGEVIPPPANIISSSMSMCLIFRYTEFPIIADAKTKHVDYTCGEAASFRTTNT